MREYTTAFAPKEGGPDVPNDVVLCIHRVAATAIGEHFAIRMQPAFHDAGEGMMMEAYVLDHMPSGYKIYGDGLDAASFDTCKLLAEALMTTPIDWATYGPDSKPPDGFRDWFRRAKDAAMGGKMLHWEEASQE